MSQQQFFPESQRGKEEAQEEEFYSPRPYRSTEKSRTGDILKNEHPSTYEESIPPYSYQAQDAAASQRRRAEEERAANAQREAEWRKRQQFSPDGDAFEYGYRPYMQYNRWQQVPPWARGRQRNRSIWRWVGIALLAALLFKPLLWLIGGLFVVGFALVSLVLLGIFAVIFALVVGFIVLMLLGVPVGPWRGRRYRGGWRRSWGGPWGR